MKKYFTKMLAIMMLACTPFSFTSCSEDIDWMSVLSELMGQFLGGNGSTTTYDCTGYVCSGTLANAANNSYNFGKNYEMTATLPLTTSSIGSTATITMPALQLPEGNGTADMTDIVLSNLAMTAYSETAISLDLGDNSGIQGSITVGGKTFEAETAYLDAVLVNDNAISAKGIYIYFGANMNYCVYFSNFNGTLSAQTKKQ